MPRRATRWAGRRRKDRARMADEWGPARAAGGRLGEPRAASTPRTRTRRRRCSAPRTSRSSRSSRSAPSTTAASTSTGSTTRRRCGAAARTTRSTPRSATGSGTAPPVRSCAGSSSRVASRCSPAAPPPPTPRVHAHAKAGDPQYSIGENKYLAEERVDAQLRGDDHDQRRRHVVLRRDDDAEDGRDGRALRPHRPQHSPP